MIWVFITGSTAVIGFIAARCTGHMSLARFNQFSAAACAILTLANLHAELHLQAAIQATCVTAFLTLEVVRRRHTEPLPRRPNPAAIAALQRDVDVPLDEYVRRHVDLELGLPPARPILRDRCVCLTKNCRGDTDELHLWGGQLAYRIHTCRRP